MGIIDPFAQRHEEIIKKIKPSSRLWLWLYTLIFGGLIFVAGSLYLFARRGNYDLYIANKVFATTALVLIGFSFALSGLCYFWDFVDTKIIYRKHLGLSGFVFALVHIITSVWFLPHKFSWPVWFADNLTSVVLGVLALLIFTIMAAISNRYAIEELGSKSWRIALRIGYIAFVFVIVHFTLLKYNGWINWFKTREPFLPPLSLLEVIFGLVVIILRIALWISKKRRIANQLNVQT
jgi:DMSO/TMAO reductase YedYZ heme-binding membrane subunit